MPRGSGTSNDGTSGTPLLQRAHTLPHSNPLTLASSLHTGGLLLLNQAPPPRNNSQSHSPSHVRPSAPPPQAGRSQQRHNVHVLFLNDDKHDHVLNRLTSLLGSKVHKHGFCHVEIVIPDTESGGGYLSSSIYNGETVTLTRTKTFANPGMRMAVIWDGALFLKCNKINFVCAWCFCTRQRGCTWAMTATLKQLQATLCSRSRWTATSSRA